ncbi:hypothetical protein Tco_0563384 [Tanacetum coccineum]
MKEINNFQQEPDETLFQAWERLKELLMKCPQHYLTEMQEVILFYNGLEVPTRHILDSRGIQAQLNNLGREIKKVNEKVYAAQVGCEQCKGPYYTKDCLIKEEGIALEEAYYRNLVYLFKEGDIERQLRDSIKGTMQILRTKNKGNLWKIPGASL